MTESFAIGLWQIIILGFFGVLSPAVVALVAAMVNRQLQRDTWARQDQQAAQAKERDQGIKAQLDVVHTLVNSGMTAAKQSEYDALARDLASMTALYLLQPTPEMTVAMQVSKEKIAALRAELDERQKQAKLIERIEAHRAAGIMAHANDPVQVEVVEGQSPIPVKIKE